ncbi:MAG: hypothetical protein AAF664_05135 [Planctomycetota bacterium]
MLSISPTYLLFYFPLLISIALVVGGTRHEATPLIIRQSLYSARWICGFLLLVFLVLVFVSWWAS